MDKKPLFIDEPDDELDYLIRLNIKAPHWRRYRWLKQKSQMALFKWYNRLNKILSPIQLDWLMFSFLNRFLNAYLFDLRNRQ